MLSPQEINLMEKNWKIYTKKKNIKTFSKLFFSIFCIAGICILAYMSFYEIGIFHKNEKIAKKDVKSNDLQDKIDKLQDTIKKDLKVFLEKNKEIKNENKKISGENLDKKEDIKPKNLILSPKENSKLPKTEDLSKNDIIDLFDGNKKAAINYSKKIKNHFTSNEIKFSEPKKEKKGNIKINSKVINFSISDLKNKFEKTGEVYYANEIAKKYYKQKDYKNAARWSFTVNSIEPNLEDGWIIFAKSKYKQGRKKDAIKVLEAFNQRQPSKQIESLILQIKMGTL